MVVKKDGDLPHPNKIVMFPGATSPRVVREPRQRPLRTFRLVLEGDETSRMRLERGEEFCEYIVMEARGQQRLYFARGEIGGWRRTRLVGLYGTTEEVLVGRALTEDTTGCRRGSGWSPAACFPRGVEEPELPMDAPLPGAAGEPDNAA